MAGRAGAAVLVPVYQDEAGEVRTVVILRTVGGAHGGQLGFPGGKRDPTDSSLRETAVREAFEEIGLGRAHISSLEPLALAATQTTGFVVAPFLAHIVRPSAWTPSPREVQRVIEPRLRELIQPENQGSAVEHHPNWAGPRRIDYFLVDGLRLWGMTYRILQPLIPHLLALYSDDDRG